MEEVSAFAAYNAANKNKKKKSPKKAKKTGNKRSSKTKTELKKELAQEIIEKSDENLKVNLAPNGSTATTPPRKTNKKKNNKKAANSSIEILNKNSLEVKEVKRLVQKPPKKPKLDSTSGKKKTKKASKNAQAEQPAGPISNGFTIDSTSDSKSPSPETIIVPRCKPEPISPASRSVLSNDSIQDGLNIFKYLLQPVEINRFFQQFWEKEPCLVQRNDPKYFSNLISFRAIDEMLVRNHVEFTKHVDITSYNSGVRETLNPEGRALPGTVWEFYESGCSVRLLNPQIFIPAIYTMNVNLQEYFHCMVGANVYLTPPSSQGFAPHYDDIEAFVLQIEGQKRWKLYSPRTHTEALPRVSSGNFSQDEIGEPILDKVLKPGDILYFPRGTIHQAKTEGTNHSLHITLSVYQKQSYADLFETLFPLMLSKAIEKKIDLRRGVPINMWHNLGVVHSDSRSKDRNEILQKCRSLLHEIVDEMPIDEAVDQMAKKYHHDALPPEITPNEKARTFHGVRTCLNKDGKPECNLEITDRTKIRLLRANILRIVEEGDKVNLYFYADNSREYHEYEPNFLEIDPEDAPSVEFLIKCYPEYVTVKDLPIDEDLHRLTVVQGLFDRGLLMLDKAIT